jgi:NADPH:quinone reductase
MKAAVFDRFGPPAEVLAVRDVPVPRPGWNELLVRMRASPLNPSDLLTVRGDYTTQLPPPATPGYEGVGDVVATGGGVIAWLRRGKRVAVIADRGGAWAEYAVVSAKRVVPVPADIPDEQAAAFFINPATALALTRHVLAVPPGEWLLQSAAGSEVGKMVIRLGKRSGFRTINVVRRPEQAEELKAMGADVAFAATEADAISEQVLRATDGRGVRFAIDPVGGATGTGVVQSLGAGGRAVVYGLLSGQPLSVNPRFLITGGKRVEGFYLGDWAKQQGIPRMLLVFRQITQLMREQVLTSEVATTYPLDQLAQAVRHVEQMARGGKVLLRIND